MKVNCPDGKNRVATRNKETGALTIKVNGFKTFVGWGERNMVRGYSLVPDAAPKKGK